MTKFNLSNNIVEIKSFEVPIDMIPARKVKEFIKLLKEALINGDEIAYDWIEKEIGKLAGDKLCQ